MVEFADGTVKAHLGATDMRIPIQYAFSHPRRWAAPLPPVDFPRIGRLDFDEPDLDDVRLPARSRSRPAATGGTAPAVLNAANEVAVAAFLAGAIGFLDIERSGRARPDGARPPSRSSRSSSSRRSTRGLAARRVEFVSVA